MTTRSRADGMIFNLDTFNAPARTMNYAPTPAQLAPRDKMIETAIFYPRGLPKAKTFNGRLTRDGPLILTTSPA